MLNLHAPFFFFNGLMKLLFPLLHEGNAIEEEKRVKSTPEREGRISRSPSPYKDVEEGVLFFLFLFFSFYFLFEISLQIKG